MQVHVAVLLKIRDRLIGAWSLEMLAVNHDLQGFKFRAARVIMKILILIETTRLS